MNAALPETAKKYNLDPYMIEQTIQIQKQKLADIL